MKKITQILMLFLGLSSMVKAQDFEPSQQAQGLLESKNVTVDYSTGIFHYKVPLYTLKSGDYELPISLDYTGKGVKVEDRPGLVGYNWTLNTGGVVTRTVRGGIADESRPSGFLWTENSTTPLKDNLTKVNQHKRDGECDIFTATFNGQSVNFILRKSGNDIYAEPLERTNVRIECVQQSSDIDAMEKISGWIITDENGTRYNFLQKEYTTDVNKEDAISFNGVRDTKYISAWYPTEIKPLNAEPITFFYRPEKGKKDEQTHLEENIYSTRYTSSYQYGKQMKEYPFNFPKYNFLIEQELSSAKDYVNEYANEIRIKENMMVLDSIYCWVVNPNFNENMKQYNQQIRMFGVLSEFENNSSIAHSFVASLESLERYYRSLGSPNAVMAADHFGRAKYYAKNCLDEVKYISSKEVSNIVSYKTFTPILESISSIDTQIEFLYKGHVSQLKLIRTKISSVLDRNRIAEVVLDKNASKDKITFLDKDGVEHQQLQFTYYSEYPENGLYSDPWGYNQRFGESYSYILETDPVYCKHHSLKTIALPDGGFINLDYEPNHFFKTVSVGEQAMTEQLHYGGIRLASIVIQADGDSKADSILYAYPLGGTVVFDKYYNKELVNYGGFADNVSYSRVKNLNAVPLSVGNNGMYYRNVIERIPGKGSTSYLFHVPDPVGTIRIPYAYWMNALPLATAVYDETGNLKKMKKNIYYADETCSGAMIGIESAHNQDFFANSDSLVRYTKKIPQLKSYEFYMDANELSSKYKSMRNVTLGEKVLNPYADIYIPNIEPRTSVVIPNGTYDLYYGGATLLKEQREYQFEGLITDSVSFNDFYTLGKNTPYTSVEYEYANLSKSVLPTQSSRKDSEGNVSSVIQKRVADLEGFDDTALTMMKKMNILSPIVKTTLLKNKNLLQETVSCYQIFTSEKDSCVSLSEQQTYIPASPVSYKENNQIYSYDKSLYIPTHFRKYESKERSYHPVEIKERSEKTAFVYCDIDHKVILKVKNALAESVSAIDFTPLKSNPQIASNISKGGYLYEFSARFLNGYMQMDKQSHGEDFSQYIQSTEHADMLYLIEILAAHNLNINMDRISCILDSVKTYPHYIDNFKRYYTPIVNDDSKFQMEDMFDSYTQMFRTPMAVPDVFKYARWHEKKNNTCITKPDSNCMNIAILEDAKESLACTIVCDQGSVNKVIPASSTRPLLAIYKLDLSAYQNVQSVKFTLSSEANYGLFVPEGNDYEAISYNSDGTIHAKFNQTGTLELYEYDAFGRVLSVKNQNGEIVKEYEYNTVINN